MQRKLVNPSSFYLLAIEAENAFALQTLFGQRMRGRREINCFFSCFHRFCNHAIPIDFELNRNFPLAKFHPISKKIQSKGSMDIGKVLTLVCYCDRKMSPSLFLFFPWNHEKTRT